MEDSPSHVKVINTSEVLLVSAQLTSMSSQSVVYTSNLMNQQAGNANTPSSHQSNSNISPLAVQLHQSGSNLNDPLDMQVHQGEVSGVMNPNGGHQIDTSNYSSVGPSDFDPTCYTSGNKCDWLWKNLPLTYAQR